MRKPALLLFVLFALATSAQTVQEWRDSLAGLNRMIAAQPQSTDLRLRKAAVNIELNQWEYAVEEYGRVLEIDPENLSAHYFRAYAYNHLRRYDLARADYEYFLRLVPRHFEAQLGLTMTKRSMGRKSEALDELNRLVAMYPDSAMAYAARADIEHEQQHYDAALYDWDEALRLRPDSQELLLAKYATLWAMRRYEEARSLYDDLVRRGVPRAMLEQLQTSTKRKK